ncbi:MULTISPECIES: hypothetical protein [Plantibacter]|uniref:hypothetical protein n=1 Tax=Plantibacter TaxID=190323 RepID=UPI001375B977|nr:MULTISPECIES: hypothetical protein [Plantibacter]MBD8103831.1 hypothetical protein [Plantibacter sp. CFBP 8775]MBD8467278.1 hypothetical protein [Plantibacter sp. CFBP 8798]
MQTPTEDGPPSSHFEFYSAKRLGDIVRLPCWCKLARSHTFTEWVAAGRPAS